MNLSPLPIQKFFDNNGNPLNGGLLFTYIAGTTTKIATYTDSTGGTPNTNPIVLDFRGECRLWLDPLLTYKFTLAPVGDTDPPTKPIWTVDQIASGVTLADLTAQIIGQIIWPRTAAEIAAGVIPASYNYETEPYDVRRTGALFNNAANDTTPITSAISVCSQSVNGAVGQAVELPLGTGIISSLITLPNNVAFRGTNKNGSIFKADASFVGSYMFRATNGTSSMFDSLLTDLTIDCNDVASLGCVISDGWQENSGLRRCLLYRFRGIGLLYSQAGYAASGGAAMNRVEDCEFFASTSGATAGIKVEQISSVGSFVWMGKSCTIAGTPGVILPRGVDIVTDSSTQESMHFEYCTSGIYLDGVGHHTLVNCTGGPSVTNLVEIAPTFTGTVSMVNCLRASATNFLKDNRAGGLGTITGADPPFVYIGTANRALTADNTVKAWCVFDGTTTGTHAPTKGFNVASVTRNAQGDYTVTFTNALTNANATMSVMTGLDTADGWWAADTGFGLGSANFTIRRGGAFAGAKVDAATIQVQVVGFGT